MKKEFTRKDISINRGCFEIRNINNLNFIKKKIIKINDIIDSDISLDNKLNFIYKACELSNIEKRQLFFDLIEMCILLYDDIDNRISIAFKCCQEYFKGSISLDEFLIKKKLCSNSVNEYRLKMSGLPTFYLGRSIYQFINNQYDSSFIYLTYSISVKYQYPKHQKQIMNTIYQYLNS